MPTSENNMKLFHCIYSWGCSTDFSWKDTRSIFLLVAVNLLASMLQTTCHPFAINAKHQRDVLIHWIKMHSPKQTNKQRLSHFNPTQWGIPDEVVKLCHFPKPGITCLHYCIRTLERRSINASYNFLFIYLFYSQSKFKVSTFKELNFRND